MHTINNVVILENCKDRLGREYDPADVMMQAVSKDPLYGELGVGNNTYIDLDRASHVVKNLRLEHNSLVGDIELLSTPMGNVAAELYKNGVELKTSIRALGKVDHSGMVRNFELIAIDFLGVAT
jgi:hypothetical protein